MLHSQEDMVGGGCGVKEGQSKTGSGTASVSSSIKRALPEKRVRRLTFLVFGATHCSTQCHHVPGGFLFAQGGSAAQQDNFQQTKDIL